MVSPKNKPVIPVSREDRVSLADELSARDPYDIVKFLCERDGVEFHEGSVTRTLLPLLDVAVGSGMYWGRDRSWAEQLLLPRVLRVAGHLEGAAQAAGVPGVSSSAIALQTGQDISAGTVEPAELPDSLKAAFRELYELADILQHVLRAEAEAKEVPRLGGILKGGANSWAPTRAVVEFIRTHHGQMTADELQDLLLRGVDLHLMDDPWDRLDRAQLTSEETLCITARGTPSKPWSLSWKRLLRVAREGGLLLKE